MINSFNLLVAAYALIWLFVFGFVVWLARRQARLQRDVQMLREALENRGGRQATGRGS